MSPDGWLWVFRAGLGFLILAALLFLLGYATDHWHDEGSIHYGLWNTCDGSECSEIQASEIPAYRVVTQAFQTIAVILFVLSPIVHFIFYCCKKKRDTGWRSRILEFGYTIGTIFHVASLLIFGLINTTPENFSWSYRMSCASSAIAGVGIFMIMISRSRAMYKFTFRSVKKSKRKRAVGAMVTSEREVPVHNSNPSNSNIGNITPSIVHRYPNASVRQNTIQPPPEQSGVNASNNSNNPGRVPELNININLNTNSLPVNQQQQQQNQPHYLHHQQQQPQQYNAMDANYNYNQQPIPPSPYPQHMNLNNSPPTRLPPLPPRNQNSRTQSLQQPQHQQVPPSMQSLPPSLYSDTNPNMYDSIHPQPFPPTYPVNYDTQHLENNHDNPDDTILDNHHLTQVRSAPRSSISEYTSPKKVRFGPDDRRRSFEPEETSNNNGGNNNNDNMVTNVSVNDQSTPSVPSAPPAYEINSGRVDQPPSYSDVIATSHEKY